MSFWGEVKNRWLRKKLEKKLYPKIRAKFDQARAAEIISAIEQALA